MENIVYKHKNKKCLDMFFFSFLGFVQFYVSSVINVYTFLIGQ